MYVIAGIPRIVFDEMSKESLNTDKVYLKEGEFVPLGGKYETINDAVFTLIKQTKGTILADQAMMVIADINDSGPGPMAAIVSFTESIDGIVCVVKEHNRNVPMIYDMQCKQLHNSKVL